jgi:hypothetical protein
VQSRPPSTRAAGFLRRCLTGLGDGGERRHVAQRISDDTARDVPVLAGCRHVAQRASDDTHTRAREAGVVAWPSSTVARFFYKYDPLQNVFNKSSPLSNYLPNLAWRKREKVPRVSFRHRVWRSTCSTRGNGGKLVLPLALADCIRVWREEIIPPFASAGGRDYPLLIHATPRKLCLCMHASCVMLSVEGCMHASAVHA